jgi:TonB family protein
VSIKPRINGTIPIDVRVRIDAEGRVTAAAPVVKQPSGLHAYLAGRAVEAARLWRFEPARENGKPVPGSETIHFVFEN